MMSEAELLALVREKDPEELTAEECAALQAALQVTFQAAFGEAGGAARALQLVYLQ